MIENRKKNLSSQLCGNHIDVFNGFSRFLTNFLKKSVSYKGKEKRFLMVNEHTEKITESMDNYRKKYNNVLTSEISQISQNLAKESLN